MINTYFQNKKMMMTEKLLEVLGYPCVLIKSKGKNLKDYKVYGNSFQSNLPFPFQSVEYIQNTAPNVSSYGYQYIDTGFKPNQDTKVEMGLAFTGVMGAFFGARTSLGSKMFGATLNGTVNMYRFDYGNIYTNLTYANNIETVHKIVADKNKIYFNDTLVHEYVYTTFSCDYNMYLLANNNSNSPVAINNNAKIYYTKIWDNGVLVRDFIPSYNVQTNVIGLYDKVNNSFYTNKGTETFLKGNDVVPTLTTPIKVLSLGETSRNLFDKNNTSLLLPEGIYVPSQQDSTNIISYDAGTTRIISLYMPCKANTTYTVNISLPILIMPRLRTATTTNFPAQGVTITKKSGLPFWDGNPVTIKTPSNARYLVIQFAHLETSYTNEELLSNLQIEQGTTATEYRPYKYIDVLSSGKNKFNPERIVAYYGDYTIVNNTYTYTATTSNSSGRIQFWIPNVFSSGENCIVSANTTNCNRVFVYATDDTTSSGTRISTSQSFVAPNTKYICVFFYISPSQIGDVMTLSNIQIEQGTTATNYEEYQQPIITTINLEGHEPLRKIGNVADYIDYKNRKIIRNIWKLELTGNEDSWEEVSSGTPNNLYRLTVSNSSIINYYDGEIITHFKFGVVPVSSTTINVSDVYYSTTLCKTYFRCRPDLTLYPTLASFKTFLQEQYANGTPVTVYYVLQTPTEEPFNDITIPTVKKTCTITASDEEIDSSNIYAKYLS